MERNGHILWLEWKRGVIIDAFERQYQAQIRQAQAFTRNSEKQVFVFVIGCPVAMDVDAFRVMYSGKFAEWQHGGADELKDLLRRWFAYADGSRQSTPMESKR